MKVSDHRPEVWDAAGCTDSCSSHHHNVLAAAELHQPCHRGQATPGRRLGAKDRRSALTGHTGLDWATVASGHGSFTAEEKKREKSHEETSEKCFHSEKTQFRKQASSLTWWVEILHRKHSSDRGPAAAPGRTAGFLRRLCV